MKYIVTWIIGMAVLAVLPLGFGDSVFVNYAIGAGIVTIAVALWAVLTSRLPRGSQG